MMDAFAFTRKQMTDVEETFQKIIDLKPEEMVVKLLSECSFREKKMFALGIMVGRASVGYKDGDD